LLFFLTVITTAYSWKCEYDIELVCQCYKCEFHDNPPIYVRNQHLPGKSNKDVKKFELDRSVLEIPGDLFHHFPNIVEFIVNLNRIQSIDGGFYSEKAEKLQLFTGSFNAFSRLGDNAFEFAPNLKKLILNYNKISKIEKTAFRNLRVLEKLDLSNNKIQYLDKEWFLGLESIMTIKMTSNQITQLPAGHFPENGRLKNLILTKNQLVFIEPLAIQELPVGCVVHLYNNTCIHDSFVRKRFPNEKYEGKFYDKIQKYCNK
jgi:Leucine-rich repeat (LRR) protein